MTDRQFTISTCGREGLPGESSFQDVIADNPKLVRPVAAKTSLSTLSKEAVLSNRNSQRALIIGIDAS